MSNSFDQDALQAILEEVERHRADIASEKGKLGKWTKDKNAEITQILKDAKVDGFPKKMVLAALRERELRKELTELREDLDEDIRAPYISAIEALGGFADTPLGAHAVQEERDMFAEADDADTEAAAAANQAQEQQDGAEILDRKKAH